jgi:DNA mismatch repair protein MutS
MLVGSFWELYDYIDPKTGEGSTSMRRANAILGLTETVHKGEGPGGTDAISAGFPENSLHKFAGMMTAKNWQVAVMSQVRDEEGNVMKDRMVSRIMSPSTHLETLGSNQETLYLAGVWLEEAAWGSRDAPSFSAVATDLSTGRVTMFQGRATGKSDAWCADDLLHFFQVHPPKEVIVWWRGAPVTCPTEDVLRRVLGCGGALLHIRQATTRDQSALESPIVREDLLRRAFRPRTLLPVREALGLAGEDTAPLERCLTNVLLFVEEYHPSAMENLISPSVWSPTTSVFLGNHALTQLNMTMDREEDSVLGIFQRTQTLMGRRAMRERLLYPIADPVRLEQRYQQVEWWCSATPEERDAVLSALRQIMDLPRLHRRISMATVTSSDVLLMDQSYVSAWRLKEILAGTPLEFPRALISPFEAYRVDFARVFDIEKAKEIRDHADRFCLSREVGPEVVGIEEQIAAAHAGILGLVRAAEEWGGLDSGVLRLEFKEASVAAVGGKANLVNLNHRLKLAEAGTLPKGLAGAEIHLKKTANSLEIPEANSLFRKILRLRDELRDAIRRELPPACDSLSASHRPTWDALEEWLALVDVTVTLGRVAVDRGFRRPCLITDAAEAGVELRGLRHPLIEAQQTRTEYVRHDVALGLGAAADGWLIYGMNASGKSSLMKAVGIAVLLAQTGSFVPAESMRLAPFRSLFTRILNTDNLWAGLSSFAVEMTELQEVLHRADPWSLVLGDEVCSGTESVSATALVAATLEWLEERQARYIFATHLHGLQSVGAVTALQSLKIWHLKVRYDAATDKLYYDRTLTPGAGSSLYGLEVAKAMGIPFGVLEKAHRIRRELTGSATEVEAPRSDWNAAVQRRACEVCGAAIVRDLEVHHIRPRAEATEGRLADGSAMNALRNLAVVCQVCHDRHHAGEIAIGAVQQTSSGPERQVVDLSAYAYRPEVAAQPATPSSEGGDRGSRAPRGLSQRQVEIVQSYIRRYPLLHPNRLLHELEEHEQIRITPQRLRSIRAATPT